MIFWYIFVSMIYRSWVWRDSPEAWWLNWSTNLWQERRFSPTVGNDHISHQHPPTGKRNIIFVPLQICFLYVRFEEGKYNYESPPIKTISGRIAADFTLIPNGKLTRFTDRQDCWTWSNSWSSRRSDLKNVGSDLRVLETSINGSDDASFWPRSNGISFKDII